MTALASSTMNYTLGIDLGGSSIKAVAALSDGTLLARKTVEFEDNDQREWAPEIRELTRQFEREFSRPPAYAGLSAPGLAAADSRSIAHMPQRLQGLEGFDWATYLRDGRAVPVLNDGHAALLGEWWVGAARGRRHALIITLGTGVGGAAMVDGRMLRGRLGRAGHIGHLSLDPDGPADVCGAPGSLEWAIGNCSLPERSEGRFATTHQLVEAYASGDAGARAIWLKSVKALAAAVVSCANLFDPEVVVVGGGIARAGKALFEPLQWYVDSMEWRPGGTKIEIAPAELGPYAGACGAAYHALH